MVGQWINLNALDGSGSFKAYLALPKSGKGPGLVIAQEIFGVNKTMQDVANYYAEEGYVVLVPDLFWRQQPNVQLGYTPDDWQKAITYYQNFNEAKGVEDIQASLDILRQRQEVSENKAGVLGFCLGGKLAYLAACRTNTDAAIAYYGVGIEKALDEAHKIKCRLVLHIAELDSYCSESVRKDIYTKLSVHSKVELYLYKGVDHAFARNGGDHYHKSSALMAHQRTIEALKAEMGPYYALSALWEKHCEYKFEQRDVPAIMATMIDEPYVSHIPTLAGGVGYKQLADFYQNHFVHNNPPDTVITPISRTIGATQLVDEVLFCFTHTTQIDWMLPGIPPTGKRVEIPLVVVVKFRGNKLCHEHIYWDQASVLVQIGLLDPTDLPVAGIETAHKVLDETLPSNILMKS